MKQVRLFLGILLFPLVLAFAGSFFSLVVELGRNASVSVLPFWAGLGGYFLFQAIFFRPIRTYVFGHELTHALVGLLSGARLKSFKVSSSGGSVVLTKTNVLIALAPYFVPIYTAALIVAYRLGVHVWPLDRFHGYFLFGAGFTLAFHFSLTHFAVSQGQSDLKQFGVFFSGVFIMLVNLVLLAGLLKMVFPDQVNLREYLAGSYERIVLIWHFLGEKARDLWLLFRTTR